MRIWNDRVKKTQKVTIYWKWDMGKSTLFSGSLISFSAIIHTENKLINVTSSIYQKEKLTRT